MTERLTFYSRKVIDDQKGNRRGAWEERFTVSADMRIRPGSEVFAAARLEGRVPYSVKVRRSPDTVQITTGWRATDSAARDYNVQAPAPDPQDRGAIHMICVLGKVPG